MEIFLTKLTQERRSVLDFTCGGTNGVYYSETITTHYLTRKTRLKFNTGNRPISIVVSVSVT